jgi:undecaprenyl-diphosphatase
VGITRIALGVHFVSDVLAGWALGAAWLGATTAAFRAWQHEHSSPSHEPMDPLDVPAAEAPHLVPSPQRTVPGGREGAVRLAAWATGLFAVLASLGLLVTGHLSDTIVGSLDRTLVRALADQRTETWTRVAEVVGTLAGTRAVVGGGLVLAVLAMAVTSSRRPALFVAVTLVGEVILYFLTAQLVQRLRPQVADLTSALPTGASWPSGHVGAAVALYGALAALVVTNTRTRWRWAVLAVPGLVAPAVGLSRIYVAAHHPTDVLAGLLLGAAWIIACAATLLSERAASGPDALVREETDRTGRCPSSVSPAAGEGVGVENRAGDEVALGVTRLSHPGVAGRARRDVRLTNGRGRRNGAEEGPPS